MGWISVSFDTNTLKITGAGGFMTKKLLFSTLLSVFCLVTMTFVLSSTADAQGQGRYANRYSKQDVGRIINKLEQSSNTFRAEFDRSMDRSNLNGTSSETRFNRTVADYENSLDRLRSDFDRNDSWWESRNNVTAVMREARPVNDMMTSLPFRQRLEAQWNRMRADLNSLADTYDLPGLNGGGWNGGGGGNGGGWNGGGQMGNVPNWAVGTFYGRSGNDDITLVVNRNGRVTADIGGQVVNGTMYRNTMNIDGGTARITRLNNGISAVRTDNGLRIDYLKTNNGGGGGWNPGDGDGQQGDVPNWAVGTFYGQNQGQPITLTISRNGRVIANVDGRATYGTMYRDTMTLDGATVRISRLDNGISAVRNDNGLRIDYSRGR